MSVRPPYHQAPMAPVPGAVAVHAGFAHPERPLGVAILAILIALIGVGALLVSIIVILAPEVDLGGLTLFVTLVGQNLAELGSLGAIAVFVGGFILVSTAQGLWHQEMWSLVLCAGTLFVAEAVIFFFFLPFTYLFFALLVLFVYLLAVRKHFS